MQAWLDSPENKPGMTLLATAKLLVAHLRLLNISPPGITRKYPGI